MVAVGRNRIVYALLAILSASCGTLDRRGAPSAQPTLWPTWARLSQAVVSAALDARTLVPAVGAAAFSINDFDERASNWAADTTVVFRSGSNARQFSDWATVTLGVEALATALVVPVAEREPGDWTSAKVKTLAVQGGAALTTLGLTQGLKAATRRERPDGSNRSSFPSGHTSGAFSFAALANRNLAAIPMARPVRRIAQFGNVLAATAVGWARVAGRKHFPSDVLAGAAIGNFVSLVIHDAFLGPESGFGLAVQVDPSGAMVEFSYRF